jgi:hypothetical protein
LELTRTLADRSASGSGERGENSKRNESGHQHFHDCFSFEIEIAVVATVSEAATQQGVGADCAFTPS